MDISLGKQSSSSLVLHPTTGLTSCFGVRPTLCWASCLLRTLLLASVLSVAKPSFAEVSLTMKGQWPGHSRGPAFGLWPAGRYAYMAIDYGGLAIIDVNDPANPVRVGGVDGIGNATDIQVSGNHAYVAGSGAGLQVIDVSDPANPVKIGGYKTSGFAHGLHLIGNTL